MQHKKCQDQRMIKYIITLVIASLSITSVIAQDAPKHFKVAAMAGDGIYSLLRRYELDKHSCNFNQFYKLNKLKKNSALAAGKVYTLPIRIYRFNGKTIRSSIGNNDWNTAVRIQKYNERMQTNGMREESFKADKVLWVPHHELNCPTRDLAIPKPVDANPEIQGGNRRFPIFGKEYAHTPLQSNSLKGRVFYIVSGHGGPDPGAMGKRGNYSLCEDEYAYDVALRLCRNLVSHGATAYMITRDPNDGIRKDKFLKCDIDEVLWGNIKMVRQQKPRLFQRSNVINDLYKKHKLQGVSDQTLIAIHVDSRTTNERIDAFFYYRPGSKESKNLALQLHKTMKAKYKKYQSGRAYKGTVSERDLHMLRETEPNAVYIELGNIRNKHDQQRIILERNRRALANWLFDGLR